jgi:hypothetical protein
VRLYVSTTARRFRVEAYRMGWYGGHGARTSRAALVVMNAVTTWQAYNLWGGRNQYVGPDGRLETRSRVVSFDRP